MPLSVVLAAVVPQAGADIGVATPVTNLVARSHDVGRVAIVHQKSTEITDPGHRLAAASREFRNGSKTHDDPASPDFQV